MKNLKLFRLVSHLEGASLLLLLFVAMPVKYIYEEPILVKIVGMLHGVLFVAYVIHATLLLKKMKWDISDFLLVIMASIFPFGTFYMDKKMIQPVLQKSN